MTSNASHENNDGNLSVLNINAHDGDGLPNDQVSVIRSDSPDTMKRSFPYPSLMEPGVHELPTQQAEGPQIYHHQYHHQGTQQPPQTYHRHDQQQQQYQYQQQRYNQHEQVQHHQQTPRQEHQEEQPLRQEITQRGVSYALQVKAAARAEFKARRRQELLNAGNFDRVIRHRRNDPSLSAREKYLRRLQKNQDSAAAARFAHDSYVACLETQASHYDGEVTRTQEELRISQEERDRCAAVVAQRQAHNGALLEEVRILKRKVGEPDTTQDKIRDFYTTK